MLKKLILFLMHHYLLEEKVYCTQLITLTNNCIDIETVVPNPKTRKSVTFKGNTAIINKSFPIW